jgi:Asp-tRNA(Asn)/Glu-tRNA(Gln) amidotransferase A subunit family amidase
MNLEWGKSYPWVSQLSANTRPLRSLNVNSIHGRVVNPYHSPNERHIPWAEREKRSAGGSSGGSAAAVAAGMCDA